MKLTSVSRARYSILVCIAVLAALAVPLAGTAAANHVNRVLDVEPDLENKGVGANHTLTARLCEFVLDPGPPPERTCPDAPPDFSTGPINIDFENENGANDPDDSISRLTPDYTCSMPAGFPTCDISFTGLVTGTDTIRAWIDHDGSNGTDESDTDEPQDDANDLPIDESKNCPGAAPPDTNGNMEPDCTDVVSVIWSGGGPSTLDCDDQTPPDTERESPSDPGASAQSYTCKVRDAQGNATGDFDPNTNGTQDIRVYGEVENGVNDPDTTDGASYESPDYQCLVGAGRGGQDPPVGQCNVGVTQNENEVGTSEICFWADDADTNTPSQGATLCADEPTGEAQLPDMSDPGNDLADQVEKTWGPRLLDCDDAGPPNTEQETNPSGGPSGTEIYRCEAKDQYGQPIDGNPGMMGNQAATIRGENENGVNDPDATDGASYDSPDYTCQTTTTAGANQGTCTISVTQGELEKTPPDPAAEICFWIELEGSGTVLCATEPTGENQLGDGSDAANDAADQVEIAWEEQSEQAGGLDAEPESDTNPLGVNHTITVTVYDQFGEPFQGNTTVNFEFFDGSPSDTDDNSPGSPDKTCTTSNSSSCGVTYTETEDPGRDLVCVWTTATPNMVGTNESGTCDGEGIDDADDTAGAADAPEPRNDDIDVVSKTWLNASPATTLDCTPESDTTERTSNKITTCTASNTDGAVAKTEIDVEATGTNDGDGNTPATPDFSCTTNGSGVCTVTHNGSSGNSLGETTYRAWIDEDYFNGTTEADTTEEVDETTPEGAGGTPEDDNTDVVKTRWIADPERTISMETSHDTREAGKKVKFSGSISGDPACEGGQTVRLRRTKRDGYTTISTMVTDASGDYEFEIEVQRTRKYKTIAPKTTTPDACNLAKSPKTTVTVT